MSGLELSVTEGGCRWLAWAGGAGLDWVAVATVAAKAE